VIQQLVVATYGAILGNRYDDVQIVEWLGLHNNAFFLIG
jgi:hypothetical protein